MPEEVATAPAPTAEDHDVAAAFGELDAGTEVQQQPEADTKEPQPGGEPQPDPTPKPDAEVKPQVEKPKFDLEKTPKGFRDYFKGQLAAKETELAKLKEALSRRDSGEGVKGFTDQLTAKETELKELRSQLSAAKFQKSPEYVEKFEKPFGRLWNRAQRAMESFEIITEKDEEGNPTAQRPATAQDLEVIFGMRNRSQALREVRQMFGPDAARVEGYLQQLYDIADESAEALASEREEWETKSQQRVAQQQAQEQHLASMWVKVNEELERNHPEWYAEDPQDKEGNELLKKGRQLVDLYFSGRNNMRAEDRVLLEANIRHKAAAFPRLARRLNQATAELAALRAKVNEDKQLTPGGQGQRTTQQTGAPEPRFGSDIDASMFEREEFD